MNKYLIKVKSTYEFKSFDLACEKLYSLIKANDGNPFNIDQIELISDSLFKLINRMPRYEFISNSDYSLTPKMSLLLPLNSNDDDQFSDNLREALACSIQNQSNTSDPTIKSNLKQTKSHHLQPYQAKLDQTGNFSVCFAKNCTEYDKLNEHRLKLEKLIGRDLGVRSEINYNEVLLIDRDFKITRRLFQDCVILRAYMRYINTSHNAYYNPKDSDLNIEVPINVLIPDYDL